MTVPSAHSLKGLPALGINPASLGCVMLDVQPLDLTKVIPEEWAYTSPNPDRKWVSGIQSEAHITLLYGLLINANSYRPVVDEALFGWQPQLVVMDALDVFPSNLPGEDYGCVVARQLTPDKNLTEAHARLSLLPHIDTFWEYKPHVTLAYVRKDRVKDALRVLKSSVGTPMTFKPIALNYGDPQ